MVRGLTSMPRKPASASDVPVHRGAVMSSATVAPPGLRAMCSAPTRSATVWLPSITRAIRIQVVCGNCRTHAAWSVGEIEGHDAEAARLQHEVRGLERARRVTRFAYPQQLRQIEPGERGGVRVEAIVRVDECDGFATRRGGRERAMKDRRAAGRARSDDFRQVARGPGRRRAPHRARPGRWEPCRGPARSTGRDVVSVTSSLRVRRSDSRCARAAWPIFRFFFALPAASIVRTFPGIKGEFGQARRIRVTYRPNGC